VQNVTLAYVINPKADYR